MAFLTEFSRQDGWAIGSELKFIKKRFAFGKPSKSATAVHFSSMSSIHFVR